MMTTTRTLSQMTNEELAEIFANLSPTITTLHLSNNNPVDRTLSQMTNEELAQTFAAIPPTITTLNLSNNNPVDRTLEPSSKSSRFK